MPRIGDQPQAANRTGRAVAAGCAALCLTLTLGACGPSSGHPSDARPTGSSTPSHPAPALTPPATDSPSPEAPTHLRSVTVRPVTKQAAHRATVAYLVASGKVLADPRTKLDHHSAVRGPAWQSLIAERTEFASKHYRVVGEPVVVSEKVVQRQLRPTQLVVAACLDNSRVRVLDRNGRTVPTPDASVRSLNLFTLERRAGHWFVVGSSFPSDPDC